MVHCCVKGCNKIFRKGDYVSFHKFPKDEVYRKIWEAQLKRENFIVKESTKICSKHFKEECFDRSKFGGTWLKKDAIPTIFPFPDCPEVQTLVKEYVQCQVKVETVLPSSTVSSVQNQVIVETVLPDSIVSSVEDQVRVDTVLPCPNVSSVKNQVKVETILPTSNFLSFQNQAMKVEEVSLSESECDSPPQEKMIVASVSQNEGDAVTKREKRKYYLGDFDENDMNSPHKARQVLALAKARDKIYKKEIKNLKKKNGVKDRKIKTLKKILNELMSETLKEDRTQKTSKRVGGTSVRTSLCIEDVLEEIGTIINEPSPTSSDCEDDSFRFWPDKKTQKSTSSSSCSSSDLTLNKHEVPDEQIQTEGSQTQYQPVGRLLGGQTLYIKNTIK